jgi:hypothetical protein
MVIFLNGFPRDEADTVTAAIERHEDFTDYMPGGGNDQRVVLELKHRGADAKLTVSRLLRELGIRHHFKAPQLPNHLEVHRDP